MPKATGSGRTKTAERNGKRPPTFDHLLKKQPIERTLPIPLNDEAVESLSLAQRAVEAALTPGELQSAKDGLRDATERLLEEQAIVVMRFRSAGRRVYDELLRQHPPHDGKGGRPLDPDDEDSAYHTATFAPALVALSCVEPNLTEEQARILFEGQYDEDGTELVPSWNTSELFEIFSTAMEVNTVRRVVELGKG